MELLFLQPIFKQRIWGGYKLKTDYGYHLESNQTGECWAISAHKNGETNIRNGQYAGTPLSRLWNEHPELFANQKPREFPLMIKILDANDDLSVQVHPDDNFAQLVENDLGKAECWYVLDAKPGAKIIYGHQAKNSEEFKQLATNGEWSQLLSEVPIQRGDFFDVPTGTVHALGAGGLILEVQQSSDTTYRLYDYDRKDAAGNLRELHLDKAFAVVTAPHIGAESKPESRNLGLDAIFTALTTNQHFQVGKLEINGELELNVSVPYLLVSVIDGEATLNNQTIKKGDHFIVPNQIRKLNFSGYATLIISNEVSTI
jgi:mannose-6-phosphate isomerase